MKVLRQENTSTFCRNNSVSNIRRSHSAVRVSCRGTGDSSQPSHGPSGPQSEDWRSFRAHLVNLERRGLWLSDETRELHSSYTPHPEVPHIIQPAQPQPQETDSDVYVQQLREDQQERSRFEQIPPLHGPPKRCNTRHSPARQHTHNQDSRPGNIHPSASGPAATPEASSHFAATSAATASLQLGERQSEWAHPIVSPEVGSVLVARQHDSDAMGFFHRTVVLIASHDEVRGTLGLVLNKPTPLTLNELSRASTKTGVEGFREAFGGERLHLGGPVHMDQVTVLHQFRGLKDSQPIAEGLYTGGLADAVQLVQAGLAKPSSFMLVLGLTCWQPQQLEEELDTGCWHCVSASPSLLLSMLQSASYAPALQWPRDLCAELFASHPGAAGNLDDVCGVDDDCFGGGKPLTSHPADDAPPSVRQRFDAVHGSSSSRGKNSQRSDGTPPEDGGEQRPSTRSRLGSSKKYGKKKGDGKYRESTAPGKKGAGASPAPPNPPQHVRSWQNRGHIPALQRPPQHPSHKPGQEGSSSTAEQNRQCLWYRIMEEALLL